MSELQGASNTHQCREERDPDRRPAHGALAYLIEECPAKIVAHESVGHEEDLAQAREVLTSRDEDDAVAQSKQHANSRHAKSAVDDLFTSTPA